MEKRLLSDYRIVIGQSPNGLSADQDATFMKKHELDTCANYVYE